MLVHTGDRGVHRHRPLHLALRGRNALDRGQQSCPGTVRGPVGEPLVDRAPVPEPLRDVTPRRTGPEPPRDPLDRPPHLHRRPSPALRSREQRRQRQHRPLLVCYLLPNRHDSTLTAWHARSVYQHALGLLARDTGRFAPRSAGCGSVPRRPHRKFGPPGWEPDRLGADKLLEGLVPVLASESTALDPPEGRAEKGPS